MPDHAGTAAAGTATQQSIHLDPVVHPLDRLGLGAVGDLLPARLLDDVIDRCGRRQQRVRALPARVTLYFTLALWFYPGKGYAEVLLELLGQLRRDIGIGQFRVPTVSAAVKARRRLGREPLQMLFRSLCGTQADQLGPGMMAFGRTVALLKVSVDGTSLDVADTSANRAAFGEPPRNGKAVGRYPKIRLVTLIASGTRAIIDAAWGPLSAGGLSLMEKLVRRGAIRPGVIVLADRYYCGHPQVPQVVAAGADLLFRATSTRVLPPVRELPDGSYLSVLLAPNLPTKGDRHRAIGDRCPRLGIKKRRERGMLVRVVEAEITVVPEQGETRCESYRLITTLLDPDVASARDLVTLYHQRWESEVGFADLKTYLRGGQSVLRSQKPGRSRPGTLCPARRLPARTDRPRQGRP
ncbi:IS4 family transposase [Streptomyces sp. NPDC056831]|uniref:IS4 family transposase n=1 Tax=Streptomyces sp. NPDC056831 TaxID=3345954 RepID=UPI00367CCE07